jgi:hypothetical protein
MLTMGMKAQAALFTAAAVLTIGTIALVEFLSPGRALSQRQVLEDGSVLALKRVMVGSRITIMHGTEPSKLLRALIPSNGWHVLSFKLNPPTQLSLDSGGKSSLVAEFKLSGRIAGGHPLVKPAFFRQFRFVIYGEKGIEFAEELRAGRFQSYPDGYYGYVEASRFPRDSRWLGFRVEKRQNQNQGGPWEKVADLRIRNPDHPTFQSWVAEPKPIIKSAGGLELALREVTIKTVPYLPRDIWNHVVTPVMEVRSNGVLLTNWTANYVQAEDASGNWGALVSFLSLDPRYVWKLVADFEPESGFADESLATVWLPGKGQTITTNVMKLPVSISWDGEFFEASIPTNQPSLALRFVRAVDGEGDAGFNPAGGWNQFFFRMGDFMVRKGGVFTTDFHPAKITFAVVPNVHTTFYVQPELVSGKESNRVVFPQDTR